MKIVRESLRIIVAVVFIFSGFVKAVDPKGFSFKLEEYFSAAVFNLPFLEKFALPLAVFVASLEFLLGVALLVKIQIRRTLYVLLAMCIFFGFLTFYSAYFNVVTDCGCFGDAVKLTPWGSFIKDMVLLLLLLVLLWLYKTKANEVHALQKQRSFSRTLLIVSFALLLVYVIGGLRSEPLIDFRDYKIGTDLNAERKKIEADPGEYKVIYLLKNSETGESKTMPQDEYISSEIWKNEAWEIQSDETKEEVVKLGYDSNIKQFKIIDNSGEDVTEAILSAPKIILLFTYLPDKISPSERKELMENMRKLQTQGVQIFGVSTSENFFSEIPNGTMDGTAIKTIARSNPFILVLQNGKIVTKKKASSYFK